jgi:glycosyltransferase involved in cell wall biosynthesis
MSGDCPDVTILVPAKDEQETIQEVIDRLLALPISSQVVVVNDGSTDRTGEILASFGDQITVVTHEVAQGKGSAIRSGLKHATGKAVIIQDADLEYVPEEIPALVKPIVDGEEAVVYGSRFLNGMHPEMALPNKMVNKLLPFTVLLLFGRRVTDEATCYKAFRRDVLEDMGLVCQRFEFCPEVTAKAIRMKHEIKEMPISYEPRGKDAGKKIRWTDGVEAFWTLFRHRFSALGAQGSQSDPQPEENRPEA